MRTSHSSLVTRRFLRALARRLLGFALVAALALLVAMASAGTASAAPKTIMVVAPHPDDDLLLAAGVISTAVGNGDKPLVVYMTNGDFNGVTDGASRDRIAIDAETNYLGNSLLNLIFLGYPDHQPTTLGGTTIDNNSGLPELLFDHPKATDTPFTTLYTQSQTYASHSPGDYNSDYHYVKFASHAAYTGANVVADLEQILRDNRPSDIYAPSEIDANTDHEATYYFLRTALLAVMASDPTYTPTLHKGFVWWDGPNWPQQIDPTAPVNQPSGWTNQPTLNFPSWSVREDLTVPTAMRNNTTQTATISANSAANPTVVTTSAAHGLSSGNAVLISGSNSTPSLNGWRTVTVTGSAAFTIPVNVTVAGTAGTVTTYPANPKFQAVAIHGDATLERYVHSDEVFWPDVPLPLPSTPDSNVAPFAAAWASNQNSDTQQLAVKAVDKVIDGSGGSPGDSSREWATNSGTGIGKVGEWLKLHWPGPVVIDRVTLYDRPNSNDQVTSGNLMFSDGTTQTVESLPNDGSALTVNLSSPKVVTGLEFAVTGVSGTTTAVGLAEIQVRGQAWSGTFSVAGGAQYSTTGTVTLNSSVSGAQQMRFSNDGSTWSSWQAYSASTTWTLSSPDGLKTVHAEYRGAGGDASAEVLDLSDQITLDTIAPVTTATGFPADWTRVVPQTVTLSATDVGGSGVDKIYYKIDSGLQTDYAITAIPPFSADGSYTVVYWSTDRAGNEELPHHVGTVKINTHAPLTTAAGLQASATTGWVNTAQTVSFSASGGTAPVTTYYTLDGGAQQTYSGPFAVSAAGSHTLTYWSVDSVSNQEGAQTGYVNIDNTVPTISSDADTKWHNAAVTVHLNAADAGGSGLVGTQYRLQGSTTWLTAVGDTFTASGAGSKVYEFRALDGAGNASSLGSCTVRIDTSRPRTTAPYAASVQRFAKVTLKFKVLDAKPTSGKATVTIKIKTLKGKTVKTFALKNRTVNSLQSYRFRCTLKRGTYRFYVYATDAAGNVQSAVAHNTLRLR